MQYLIFSMSPARHILVEGQSKKQISRMVLECNAQAKILSCVAHSSYNSNYVQKSKTRVKQGTRSCFSASRGVAAEEETTQSLCLVCHVPLIASQTRFQSPEKEWKLRGTAKSLSLRGEGPLCSVSCSSLIPSPQPKVNEQQHTHTHPLAV